MTKQELLFFFCSVSGLEVDEFLVPIEQLNVDFFRIF